MEIRWSDWQYLTAENIKTVPELAVYAVYEIRLADGAGIPAALKRANGVDDEGITYIGASGERSSCCPLLQGRLTKHRYAHVSGKRGGARDEDLNLLWRKIKTKYGPGAWLQYRYVVLASRHEALGLESRLQNQHHAQFGEKHDYLWKNQAHPLFE